MEINIIHIGNCLKGLKLLPDNSVNCCVTSPPYFNLRDYGVLGQIGLEETPEDYISNCVDIFREVKRVLTEDGTLWLNVGDSYNGSGKGAGDTKILKPKDLIGIPWMLAFALRADGWYLRQDIIWHKSNPMPESVTDRCTKSHEYLFLLSKSKKYFFDQEAIKTESKNPFDDQDRILNRQKETYKNLPDRHKNGFRIRKDHSEDSALYMKANKRSVWTVPTKPFKEAHFATFPLELIVDCIKAGCPEGGIVLDPFMGAGTTAIVARKLNRNYVGFELKPEYVKIANNRIDKELGMFK